MLFPSGGILEARNTFENILLHHTSDKTEKKVMLFSGSHNGHGTQQVDGACALEECGSTQAWQRDMSVVAWLPLCLLYSSSTESLSKVNNFTV